MDIDFDENIWSSKEAMIPKFLPKDLIIVGSGAIGIEYASIYNALGSNVTVFETQDRILPQFDKDISTEAKKIFEKKGIKFVKIERLNNQEGKTVEFKNVLFLNDNKTTVKIHDVLLNNELDLFITKPNNPTALLQMISVSNTQFDVDNLQGDFSVYLVN